MSDEGAWFHCGRCGHLFRGAVGRMCPRCGGHPVVEEKELAFLEAAREAAREIPSGGVSAPAPDRRKHRRRKPRSGLAMFVIGWLVFLGLLAGLVTYVRNRQAGESGGSMWVTDAAEDQRVFNDAYQKCSKMVGTFLTDTTPEGRAKLVHDRAETLRKMVRSGGAALRAGEDEKWEWQRFSEIKIGGGRAFEGVVVFADGKRGEFVFLPEGDEDWGIDWANLVRYSDHPWPLFLSGDTPATGEFRLLARRRAGPSGQMGDVTSIVFFGPDAWHPKEPGVRSPEVEIAPGSREATMLREAFKARDDGHGAFGSKLCGDDPAAMVRVRVKLRREPPREEGDEPRIELEELLACHWLSVDDPGVDVGDE